MYVSAHVPAPRALAALAAENFFYSLSVAIAVLFGVAVLFVAFPAVPEELRTISLVIVAGMTAVLVGALWLIAKEPALVSATLGRRGSPRILGKIRDLVAQHPEQWFAARDAKPFADHWSLDGERLSRPPRGYDPTHAAIEDIKRKDFVAVAPLSFNEAISSNLVKLAGQRFAETVPLMNFLCTALGVAY